MWHVETESVGTGQNLNDSVSCGTVLLIYGFYLLKNPQIFKKKKKLHEATAGFVGHGTPGPGDLHFDIKFKSSLLVVQARLRL